MCSGTGLTLTAYSNATAYTQNVMQIKEINVGMTYNAVHATDALCPKLEFVVLQTGTNVCGLNSLELTHERRVLIIPELWRCRVSIHGSH